MKHCRKYSDFARFFADERYAAKRVAEIYERAVEKPNGCLELPPGHKGYAQVGFAGVQWQAHRLLWLIEHGDIGELVVDHKCRNRACINMAHVEPVPNAENVRRGKEFAHGGRCPKGHRLTQTGRQLHCVTCKNEHYRDRYRTDPQFAEAMREKRRRNYANAKAA